MPDDELDKLRSALVHAYDPPKYFTRRIIEAVKRPRDPKKAKRNRGETKKTKDAA